MDPRPRDQDHNTCLILNLSEMDLPLIGRHVDGSEVLDLHRTTTEGTTHSSVFSSDHDRHRTVVINHDQDTLEDTRCSPTYLDAAIAIKRWAINEGEHSLQ